MMILLMATALAGGDPDGVMATAPETPLELDARYAPAAPSVDGGAQDASPHGLSTDQQIERWVAARGPAPSPPGAGRPWIEDDRAPHGEFSVTVGTGGYRDYAAAVSLPVGETGRLDVSYRQVENGLYGYGYGPGDPYFHDSGYVFPGYQSDAPRDFEIRAARPDGPPSIRRPVQPLRRAP